MHRPAARDRVRCAAPIPAGACSRRCSSATASRWRWTLHLARLAASAWTLHGAALPDDLRARALGAAAGLALARLRITYRPGDRAALTLTADPIEPARPAVHLRSVTVPGGVGAHKWADRGLLEALGARVAPAQPLLCDLDGYVLEAERANVFALTAAGTLSTPPLDGRILPGVTRGLVLELAPGLEVEPRQEPLTLAALTGAREVVLTGALGGAERVHSLDGRSLAGEGFAERVARGLAGMSRPVAPAGA